MLCRPIYLIFLLPQVYGLVSLSDVGDVISFTHEVVIDVLQTWKVLSPIVQGPDHIDLPLLKDREKRLLSRISDVTRRVDRVDRVLQGVAEATMLNLQEDIPSQIRTEMRLDALLELVTTIHATDDTFQEYVDLIQVDENSTRPQLEQLTLVNFASYVVSHNPDSVHGLLDRLHFMISPESTIATSIYHHKKLFDMVLHALQETESKLCHVEQSPHQVLFNLYNSLQLTQLKGYTMMQFSWMLLRLYKKGEFTVESAVMREKYINRMTAQVRAIKEALKSADQGFWKCDPKHHVEGETYVQLTRLLQGYVQNEVDLNPKESCSENCGYYSYTKQHGCFKNEFCSKQRACKGDIVDCQFIDSDMYVCQADPRVSSRRYDWIAYENGRVLGSKGTCYRKNKVDSWWRWLFWHCSYCFCICDDSTYSDRYFNLRSVTSNVAKNKVVVGIRFVKNNGIIHLQIQEAEMLPFGGVNQTSIQWRPVDQYSVKSEDVVEGQDYLMLSYKQRGFDLDELKAPEGYVVTGVKFRKVGTHLNLEVQATPFNFTTGLLKNPERMSLWISNDNTDASLENPRTQVKLESPDYPLHSVTPSKIVASHDHYLLFTHSDVDLDAAQTTVPFFDAQIVAPKPATLLSGIGLYYKTQRWFGGFVGPKVLTYDYSSHLQDTFPELKETEYVLG